MRRLRPVVFDVRQRTYLAGAALSVIPAIVDTSPRALAVFGLTTVGWALGRMRRLSFRRHLVVVFVYDILAAVGIGVATGSAVLAAFMLFAATGVSALVLPARHVRGATIAAGLAAAVLTGFQIWGSEVMQTPFQGGAALVGQVFTVAVSGAVVAVMAGLFGAVRRALSDSEAETRSLGDRQLQFLRALPSPVVIHQMGRIRHANEAARRLFGDELGPEVTLLDLVHPADRTAAIRRMGRVMDGRSYEGYHLRVLAADGRELTVTASSLPTTYEGRPAIALILYEGVVDGAGDELRTLFERLPVALYRSTPTGEVIEANPALIDLLGYPDRETLLGDRSVANDAHVDLARREEWRRRIEAEGVLVDFEQEMRRHDGTTITVSDSARAVTDESGRVLYYEGVLVDVTASKQVERSRRRLARVLEGTSDLVGAADPRGRVIYANAAARRFFGVAEGEELGELDALDVLGLDSGVTGEEILEALDREGVWSGELVVTSPTGVELPVSLFIQTHRDGKGRIEFYSMIARDLTAAKEAERRLAESVQARDRFVATVSHELRTPLTAVVGLLDELVGGYGSFDDGERLEMLELVAGQAHEMAAIIEDLLVAARAETGGIVLHVGDVDLRAEAESVIRALPEAEIRGVGVFGEAGARGDPRRVRQIVRNLITNALRYGGREIAVRVGTDGVRSWLEVVDSGPGLAGEDVERVFEPYQRGRHDEAGSVGLGLSVSRQLARLMGGDLTYRREGGSVFRLELTALESVSIPPEQARARA